ncbi:MAG: BTAD domain-containing putative transcriptional regulator [Spirochaetota bacterium]|nr:BTAD domain-containing putative transcriptional regulator [Spirochaetota bacterium]
MDRSIQILSSKQLPPSSSDIIKRERLHTLLSGIPKKRITAVIAGAGFGKTTLIADVCKNLDLDTVWYRLDKSDNDIIPFFHYLILGVQKYYPKFGNSIIRRIKKTGIIESNRIDVLAALIREFEKHINKDILICLDDYHLIEDSVEINESLKYLIEHLSPQVHLIVISRVEPDLHLSRFRARREMLDIREDDLFFSISEIDELYSKIYNINLNEESLRILQQKTRGWVSGLILFYHLLRCKSHDEIRDFLLHLKNSPQVILQYLEDNIYDLQSSELKQFLIKTSILSRISADFCDQLLNINNSKEIIMTLEAKHLFTFPLNEEREWFTYHIIFQEFLMNRLKLEMSREAILKLHRDAAGIWEKEGEDEEALRHYLMAEQLEKAWTLLRMIGLKLLKEGRFNLINSYLKIVPDIYLNEEPWVKYLQALALELSSKPQEAIRAYSKAHKSFAENKSSNGIVLSLNSLGYNYFLDGDFLRAEMKLKELLGKVKDNPRFSINVLINLMHLSYHLGKLDIGDQYFKYAMSLLSGFKDSELLAELYINNCFRYIFSGDVSKSLTIAEQTKELCENLGLYDWLVFDYCLISISCYSMGLFSRGMENAIKGMELCKERELDEGIYAILLLVSALNAVGLGRIEESIESSLKSLGVFQKVKSRWCQAWVYYALNHAYMKSGNLKAAEDNARKGIEIINDLTLPLEEGSLKRSLAESLIEQEKLDEAHILLDNAEKLLKNSKLNISRIYLLYARLYWKQKQRDLAIEKLIQALNLCEANEYDIWIINEERWIKPLLIEIFLRGKMQDYLNKIFSEIGIVVEDNLRVISDINETNISEIEPKSIDESKKATVPGLRVFCFGKFMVYRGDEEIQADRWKSKKAKMLFKYLLISRPRGFLAKEVLMELFWPGEDPKRVSHRLQVVLSSLRRIVEPEILRWAPSSYIIREGDSYQLYLGDDGWSDIDEFQQELRLAESKEDVEDAISHYLKAEAVYGGDFLSEDLYVTWCTEERARLKDKYLDLLQKIISYYEGKGDYSKGIEYAKKFIEVDKYSENIYQQLMTYYSKIGNKSMVTKTYERCKENIGEDLDTPLADETEELYRKLI